VGWEVTTTALNTDHKMVSVKIDQKAPYIGRGRWTMPLYMLKDKALILDIQCLGRELEDKLDNREQMSPVVNPQVHFQNFKDEIVKVTRKKAKVAVPKMNLQIQRLQEECKNLLKSQSVDTIET
jgi:hypothetical protein